MTNIEVKVETRCVAHRNSFSFVCEGYCQVELDQTSGRSVSHPRLQEEFVVTHPAVLQELLTSLPETECALECAVPPCYRLPHRRLSFTHYPSSSLLMSPLYYSPVPRIPSMDLGSLYQEERTNLTQTRGIQLWWCQMCYQTDQLLEGCCELHLMFLQT